jgi:hypothetical protein
VFLIGSGAVLEAGMPNVYGLTRYLLRRLSKADRLLISPTAQAVRQYDSRRRLNIEHLLDALEVLRHDSTKPWLKPLLRNDLQLARREYSKLAVTLKREAAQLFLKPPSHLSIKYLKRLLNFKPPKKPLHIFTTNFDLCIETALRDAGVDPNVEMGGQDLMLPIWSYLQTDQVNLFKLHGSVDWFDMSDYRPAKRFRRRRNRNQPYNFMNPHLGIQFPQIHKWSPELSATDIQRLFRTSAEELLEAKPEACPQIVLGTLEKVLPVDPYHFLLECFRTALKNTGVLVVIGYGWGDKHLNRIILEAWLHNTHQPLRIYVISPYVARAGLPISPRVYVPYRPFKMTARNALETNAVLNHFYRSKF